MVPRTLTATNSFANSNNLSDSISYTLILFILGGINCGHDEAIFFKIRAVSVLDRRNDFRANSIHSCNDNN